MALRPQQKAFLAAYRESGCVSMAARAAKLRRRAHYEWLEEPEYAEEFADAKDEAVELLEGEARRRAIRADRPSDLLMIFLLKAARPDVYRDNATVTHQGANGGPITVQVEFVKPAA